MENETLGLRELVAQNEHIEIRKAFFGLVKQPVYKPTGSKLKFTDKYYGPALRSQLEELFTLSEAALVKRAADGKWQEKVNGNLLLETALSADRQFAAIRLMQYGTIDYRPATDVRFLTGDAAKAVAKLADL
ncbi:MAG: hypothetical protein IJ814_02775 [Paludibacteraceae bacterium]|nr:hypothetical protein [Paludibacteraceae bacterium]